MGKTELPVFRRIDWLYIALFFASFLNSALGAVFYISLLLYWRYGVEGCVKALLLMTARGVMNTALVAATGNALKLVIMLATSVVIIFKAGLPLIDRKKVNAVILSLLPFVVMTAITTLATSSYPVTSLSKLISFAVPLCAIFCGIANTKNSCRWSDYFTCFFLILYAVSLVLIPFDQFRTVNQRFQGVFNHVNVLGIVSALFIAVLLNSELFSRRKMARTAIVLAVIWMVYLSGSRTGMLSALGVLVAFYLTQRVSASRRLLSIVGIGILAVLVVLMSGSEFLSSVEDTIFDFLYKGHEQSIWYSRENVLAEAERKYSRNPAFGSGFMVPYVSMIVDYGLRLDLTVEPGNLIWALLGDTGIVGMVLFVIFLIVVLAQGQMSRFSLLLGAIVINMGEVVFFSSNNIAVWVYFLMALYVFPPDKIDGEENNENRILYANA